jgi:hypothetical protein
MPASYPPSPSGPEFPDRSHTAPKQRVCDDLLTGEELDALIAFFLLLDAWDKKEKLA